MLAGVTQQGPPSIMSRLVFRFNPLCRLHASSSCVSSSEKLMNFMDFHNSCTRNCDHHILLNLTGNTHKESCHKFIIVNTCERARIVHNQNLLQRRTMVAFTIKETNYLMVSLFCDVVLPLSYLYLWY